MMELLYPLFAQVIMTFTLLMAMGYCRYTSTKRKEVRVRDIALREANWPEQPTKFSNAFHNQLETPILFYLLIVLLIITKQADIYQLYLAWAYIAVRLVHLVIHLTNNNVLHRFISFVISIVILMIMWGKFIAAQI